MIISKSALEAKNCRERRYYYRSAREGFGEFLHHKVSEGSRGILLPAFIGWSPREGSGIFDPVKKSGLEYEFYDLNSDLTVNVDRLCELLERGRYSILLVVHYFGRTDPGISRIHEAAKKHGVVLVEDLAHGFFSSIFGGVAGTFGDACLFSLHKMFPVAYGGIAAYKGEVAEGAFKSTAPELAQFILDYNWLSISNRRRRNYLVLEAALKKSPVLSSGFSLLWDGLDDGDVPQTLPIRLAVPERDALYQSLNDKGFGVTSLYHTLIPELAGFSPTMEGLSRTIMNFPVHQDVEPALLEAMVGEFTSEVAQMLGKDHA